MKWRSRTGKEKLGDSSRERDTKGDENETVTKVMRERRKRRKGEG